MTIVTFCCILGIAVILGGLFAAFKSGTSLLNLAVKMLAPAACLILALISANLSSSFGGYTLFICIGISFALVAELFKCVKPNEKTKADTLFLGGANLISLISFLAAGLVLVKFNFLGLGMGLLLGLGISCILMIFRKLTIPELSMVAANIAIGGMVFGQGIVLLVSGFTLWVSVIYFICAIFALAQLVLSVFVKENKIMCITSDAIRILSLIMFAISIFFMI